MQPPFMFLITPVLFIILSQLISLHVYFNVCPQISKYTLIQMKYNLVTVGSVTPLVRRRDSCDALEKCCYRSTQGRNVPSCRTESVNFGGEIEKCNVL